MFVEKISFEDFLKVQLHVGTVLEASPNVKARKIAYIIKIDFGELGVKTTSAQICDNYKPETLIGKQVVAIINFAPKNVAGVISEVLILAAIDSEIGTVLLRTDRPVKNGTRIS